MARIHFLLLLVAAWISLVAASSAPTFCKCTCFKNSTIIPLGPEHQSDSATVDRSPNSLFHESIRRAAPRLHQLAPQLPVDHHRRKGQAAARSASTSCSECTKAFCLSQGIDFCKDAEEDDVLTLCFQRDSNKDKIIVWGFIFGTLGLLGWAAFRRIKEWREGRSMGRQDVNYAPVTGGR